MTYNPRRHLLPANSLLPIEFQPLRKAMYSWFKFNTNVSLLLGVILLFLIGVAYLYSQTYKLRHIPSVGSNLPILSHLNAFRFLFHSKELIAEGSHNYPDGIFKIPDFLDWRVVVQGPKLIAEYRKVPVFSSRAAFESGLHFKHTFHPVITITPTYHIPIIKTQLTRALATITSEIHDEMLAAFDDYLPINNNAEWESFPILEIIMKIVCRAGNRVFVGLPLCRDPDFVSLLCKRTGDIMKTAQLLDFCPKFLHRLIAPLISDHQKQLETVQRLLAPLIEARRQEVVGKEERTTTGQWTDLLTSLVEDPFGKTCSDVDLTCRVLLFDLASTHATSMTLTQALYDLATYPEYAEPLRQEVARLVECDGWTKAAIEQMDKMDSFLKESMRLNTVLELTMPRIALEDYTFAQTGTLIPKGTFLNVVTHDAHFDGDTYPEPTTFDGFRFFKLKSQAVGNERHFDVTTTSAESLGFGSGVHACPGRFFAANEIKLMLAHVVLNYDIKFENGRVVRPLNKHFKGSCIPDPAIKLLFRKRKNLKN